MQLDNSVATILFFPFFLRIPYFPGQWGFPRVPNLLLFCQAFILPLIYIRGQLFLSHYPYYVAQHTPPGFVPFSLPSLKNHPLYGLRLFLSWWKIFWGKLLPFFSIRPQHSLPQNMVHWSRNNFLFCDFYFSIVSWRSLLNILSLSLSLKMPRLFLIDWMTLKGKFSKNLDFSIYSPISVVVRLL